MAGLGPRSAIERAEIGNSRPTVVRACALLDPHLTTNDPLTAFARAGFELHQALQPVLLEESGIDIGYRENPVIHPAFTTAEAETLQAYALERRHDGPGVQWLEGQALWDVEPHVNRAGLGALVTHQE